MSAVRTPGSLVAVRDTVKVGRFNLCPCVTAGGSSTGIIDERETAFANAQFIATAWNAHDDLIAALARLIAVDDAHSTLHAPDGDDVARMIEYVKAHKFAREVFSRATGVAA